MQKDKCQERIHIRNTHYIMKRNGTQRILILFLTHANFSTHANILWNKSIDTKILWTHATHAKVLTHVIFFNPPHKPFFFHPSHLQTHAATLPTPPTPPKLPTIFSRLASILSNSKDSIARAGL